MPLIITPGVSTIGTGPNDQTVGAITVQGDTATGTVVTKTGNIITIGLSASGVAASSAAKWTTARTVTFAGGDVTGSFTIDGSADVSNVALTVGADKVALGTDTTGNYVAGLVQGTGISLTNNTAGEGISPTIAIDNTVATLTGVQTFTNKSFVDSTTTFIDDLDNTKKMQLQLSGITNSTTRTLTVPNVDGTLITNADTGTVTSTMIADGTILNVDINASAGIAYSKLSLGNSIKDSDVSSTAAIAITKLAASTISGVSLGNNLSSLTAGTGLTYSAGSAFNGSAASTLGIDTNTVVTIAGIQTLTNKSLSDNTTFFIDEVDATKRLQFQLSGVSPGTTRTLTIPDTSGTIALTSNKLSAFAATTSSELAGVISDETGTGSLVFSASPTFTGTANFAAISTTGNVGVGGDLTVTGNLTVNGTTTTVNSTTITVDDINIELGSVATPTDTTANGGGITLKGATDKTFSWNSTTAAWTSSEHMRLAAGKNYVMAGSTSGTITFSVPSVAGTNTLTFPAVTGTVVTTGDTGSVTSTMIADGTIVNADISASAAIAVTKLAASTISGVTLGNNLSSLTAGTGLTYSAGSAYNGSAASTLGIDTSVITTTGANTGGPAPAVPAISGLKHFSGGISSTTNTYSFGTGTNTGSIYFTPGTNTYGFTKNGVVGDVLTVTAPSTGIIGLYLNGTLIATPAPNDTTKYLRGDGSWTTIPAGGGATLTLSSPLTGTSYNGSTNITTGLANGYGDTQNPYASKTANTFLAAPNGAAGAPTFRAIAAADIPTLNQNTTGTAANVTGVIAVANGGTGANAAAGARTNLGATTVGSNLFTLTNPSAVRFIQINADNSITTQDAATFRSAIGAGTGSGTVTGVTGTPPVASSGGTAPVISLNTAYGDTLNPYASKTANQFLAAPNGAAGAPSFRAIVAADIPTLNQNTTGTAANVTGIVAIANGGTAASTAAAARTNLGATTVGSNFYTLTNPSAITFPRINADNSVSTLDAATFRGAIGAGTGNGDATLAGTQTFTGTKTFSGGMYVGSGINFGTANLQGSMYFTSGTNTYGLTKNGGGSDVFTVQPSGISIDGVSTLPKAPNNTTLYLRGDGTWAAVTATNQTHTNGSYITGGTYNGSAAVTWNVDATTTATASKVMARDGNGYAAAVLYNVGSPANGDVRIDTNYLTLNGTNGCTFAYGGVTPMMSMVGDATRHLLRPNVDYRASLGVSTFRWWEVHANNIVLYSSGTAGTVGQFLRIQYDSTAGGANTITVPAVTGRMVTTGDTGTVTNTMLAGSIANTKLANSSITINGTAVSLGGSITVTASSSNQTISFVDGSGDGPTVQYNGTTARTIGYNSVGAPSRTGTNASGTWGINITGSAASATTANSATSATTAGSITGQANSATITATPNNVANQICQRDSNGYVTAKRWYTMDETNTVSAGYTALTGYATIWGSTGTIIGSGTLASPVQRVVITSTSMYCFTDGQLNLGVGYTSNRFGSGYFKGNVFAAGRILTGDKTNETGVGTGQLGLRRVGGANYWTVGPDFSDNFVIYRDGTTGPWLNKVGTNAWQWSSDIRLKNVVADFSPTSSIEKVKNLNPIIYTWKNDSNNHLQYGYSAQDVQQWIPEAISTFKDPDTKEDRLGIAPDIVNLVHVRATQELINENVQLKNRLASLEERLAILESKLNL